VTRRRRPTTVLIGALALTLTGGTCDRYYSLRRSARLETTPGSSCVAGAIEAAGMGKVTHRCDTSSDTGQLTDYFRLGDDGMDETVTLAIPHTPGIPSEARFYWGQLNRRPTQEQTARIRRVMDLAYAAAKNRCVGWPDAIQVKEECDWCE
jgi:hypothetical protein